MVLEQDGLPRVMAYHDAHASLVVCLFAYRVHVNERTGSIQSVSPYVCRKCRHGFGDSECILWLVQCDSCLVPRELDWKDGISINDDWMQTTAGVGVDETDW